jgi:hypothetical protein
MVYNNQKYWGFGLCPLLGILKIRECHKIFTSLFLLVSDLCTHYHNFYSLFFLFSPLRKSCFGYLYSCSYTDMDCPVIEVSSFYGTQDISHLRIKTNAFSEKLCF